MKILVQQGFFGNDGYYLEEWKKDMSSYLKKAKELDINHDLSQQ